MSAFTLILVFFAMSQLYWGWRLYRLLSGRIVRLAPRLLAMAAIAAVWFALFEYSFGGRRPQSGPHDGGPGPVGRAIPLVGGQLDGGVSGRPC